MRAGRREWAVTGGNSSGIVLRGSSRKPAAAIAGTNTAMASRRRGSNQRGRAQVRGVAVLDDGDVKLARQADEGEACEKRDREPVRLAPHRGEMSARDRGICDTRSASAPGPPNRPNVTNTPSATNAATFTSDSNATAKIMPSWRSFECTRRRPKITANSAMASAT